VEAQICPPKNEVNFSSLLDTNKKINEVIDRSEFCKQHENEFNNISTYKNDNKKFNRSLSEAKLIILGEEHVNPIQRNYADYLEQILKQNSKIDCVFLEWNPSDINVQKLIKGEKLSSIKFDQHYELVQAALKRNIKIFAIDGRDQTRSFELEDSDNYIHDSNKAMHKNIKQKFDSKTCKNGVLLVGKAHIENSIAYVKPEHALNAIFKKDGISTVAINMIYTGKNVYSDRYDQEWIWNICFKNIIRPVTNQVVIGKEKLNSNDKLSLFYVNSFDFNMYLPEITDPKILYR
jgi:hypothetical protein